MGGTPSGCCRRQDDAAEFQDKDAWRVDTSDARIIPQEEKETIKEADSEDTVQKIVNEEAVAKQSVQNDAELQCKLDQDVGDELNGKTDQEHAAYVDKSGTAGEQKPTCEEESHENDKGSGSQIIKAPDGPDVEATTCHEEGKQGAAAPAAKVKAKAKAKVKQKHQQHAGESSQGQTIEQKHGPKSAAFHPITYEGHFSHPVFGNKKMDITVNVKSATGGVWCVGKKSFNITVKFDGDKVELADGMTKFDGTGNSKGILKGEVFQEAVGGGAFQLKLKKDKNKAK